MKLFEEINTDYLGTDRYSLYHLNRADNFLIKNSLKFFLVNTSEKNLLNSLNQYNLLRSIEIDPVVFTPNIQFFLENNVPEKNIIETNSFSFMNNFNEIIKYCNSNYIFIISSNILLENIDEIVNRFYLTYQNFSNKLAGWSVNIVGENKANTYLDYKIENNIYCLPCFSKEFFCLKTEIIRKIGYLPLIKENEDCHGLEYLISYMISQREEYFVGDFNFNLNLIEKSEIKKQKLFELQFKFFETNKLVYNLDDEFNNYWKTNLVD